MTDITERDYINLRLYKVLLGESTEPLSRIKADLDDAGLLPGSVEGRLLSRCEQAIKHREADSLRVALEQRDDAIRVAKGLSEMVREYQEIQAQNLLEIVRRLSEIEDAS